jgi:hypothetical protein
LLSSYEVSDFYLGETNDYFPLNTPAFAGRTSVRRVFPSTDLRLAYQQAPSHERRPFVSRPPGLRPAFVPTASSVSSPLSVGARCALKHRPTSGPAALPQGSSLRSGFCGPGPSTLIRPHPPHSQAQRDFTALQLIRPVLAVRFRLGDPRLVPCFHCSFFLNMSPSTTPGSPLPTIPQIRFAWGHLSELHYASLALRPADLFTLLTDLTGFAPAIEDFYYRAYDGLVTHSVAGYRYAGNWVISTGGTWTR